METQISQVEESVLGIEPQSGIDLRLKYFCYASLVVVVIVFAAVRIRLRSMPLERDEGEYAYAGQLMLQGIPPYQLAYNMKLPGTYAAYAVMMALFGQTIAGIRIGMLVVLLANTLLLFLLTRKLFGLLAATVAAASYTLMANRWSTVSLDGHATHFIVLTTLIGILTLFKALDSGRKPMLFISGLSFGMAFLMKQHGVLFAIFGFLFWLWSQWRSYPKWSTLISGATILGFGMAFPYLVTCAVLWHAGLFRQFWFWTVSYGAAYEQIVSLQDGWGRFLKNAPKIPRPGVVWGFAVIGIPALFWSRARQHRFFLLSFALFALLAVCPGLYFRPHYFLVLLPVVAMLAGIAISSTYEYLSTREVWIGVGWVSIASLLLLFFSALQALKGKIAAHDAAVLNGAGIGIFRERRENRRTSVKTALIPIIFFVISFIFALTAQRKFLFHPLHAHRQMHPDESFIEAVAVGQYVRDHTTPQDRVAVLASEPEIYFYSGRHSATGFIYMDPLTEQQQFALGMQKDLIREVTQAQPKIIVYSDSEFTWGCRAKAWPDSSPSQDMNVFAWMHGYLDSSYKEIAEIPIFGKTSSDCSYFIYQRKEAGEVAWSPTQVTPLGQRRFKAIHDGQNQDQGTSKHIPAPKT